MLKSLSIQDFRCLETIENLAVPDLAVFFGPNGAGKTSVFDAVALVRDCCLVGVESALVTRKQGVGLLRAGSLTHSLGVRVADSEWGFSLQFPSLDFGLSGVPGEDLTRRDVDEWRTVFSKPPGQLAFEVFDDASAPTAEKQRDKTKLAWEQFISVKADNCGRSLWELLRRTAFYRTRMVDLYVLKDRACDASPQFRLRDDLAQHCGNLWSVLRNLNDCRDSDVNGWNPASRYETVLKWTKRAFPSFEGWRFTTHGSTQVYCSAKVEGIRDTIAASQLPDGIVQFTFLMAAMFGEEAGAQLILLDEPDLSLHPWALFVLAEAIEDATKNWNRQVLLATHSPVLLSQFSEDNLYLMMPKNGRTSIQRLSDMEEPRDLLNQYSAGTLYMTQLLGAQSEEPMVTLEPINE